MQTHTHTPSLTNEFRHLPNIQKQHTYTNLRHKHILATHIHKHLTHTFITTTLNQYTSPTHYNRSFNINKELEQKHKYIEFTFTFSVKRQIKVTLRNGTIAPSAHGMVHKITPSNLPDRNLQYQQTIANWFKQFHITEETMVCIGDVCKLQSPRPHYSPTNPTPTQLYPIRECGQSTRLHYVTIHLHWHTTKKRTIVYKTFEKNPFKKVHRM